MPLASIAKRLSGQRVPVADRGTQQIKTMRGDDLQVRSRKLLLLVRPYKFVFISAPTSSESMLLLAELILSGNGSSLFFSFSSPKMRLPTLPVHRHTHEYTHTRSNPPTGPYNSG